MADLNLLSLLTENKMNKKDKEKHYDFNEGRLTADGKWIDAINDRIKELEESVGIPELKRLIKKIRYTWRNNDGN